MTPCSSAAPLLFLLQALLAYTDIDSSSFLIYNRDHNKCVRAESATSITVARCDPNAKEQQFRWTSGSRLLSMSLQLCVGVTEISNWVKVLLFPCDEKNKLQHWQCKNETLFGLKDVDLHFNWGNQNERNIMVYKGSGSWSRWRTYGTERDLCSKGYQEIFTLGGNAYGSPCQFPFQFNHKWYSACTVEGRTDGQLWCATETNYNEDGKWGFCPTKANGDWDTDPVTGVQYQRNVQAVLTWYQARKSCQQQAGDLLSIVELHEQSYISGLTNTLGSSLWVGLNSLEFESGWQWSNGNPFRYLNWAPGHPSSEPSLSCVVLNAGKAAKWESSNCNKKLGYICRRGNSTNQITPIGTEQLIFCPSHWVPYAGHCYSLQRGKKMWKDALSACHKDGADLASVHNIEEQSFLISQLGYLPTDELWLGLNDQRNQMLFEWTDRSHVTFTLWHASEPSHDINRQEDCVLIRGKDGKWADHTCDKEYGYICKKKASSRPAGGAQEDVNPGCKLGWVRYASYCYNIGAETKMFDEAGKACTELGSHLVDVSDRFENAFLISLVGLRPEKYFWMGLSNIEDIHTFKWTTQREVKFTHFNIGMPARKHGCVAMTTGVFAGLWDVVRCSNKEKYICKKRAEGVAMSTVAPTTPALSCPPGWNSLSKRNACFKLYKESPDKKKTWAESQAFCKAIGGDLASIHSSSDLNNAPFHGSDQAWIGLSSLNSNEGFVWNDASPVNYENWGFGEPNNYNEIEHCTEVQFFYGRHWNDRHCEAYNDWICEIRKGVMPKPEPTTVTIVYNTTEDGWVIYNDTQYFINPNLMPMEEARGFCRKRMGDLAVITGEHERKFLWKQIARGTAAQYYIGMRVNLDKSFSWVDNTPVTYTAWDHNEPNFANNDENCVSIYMSMGFWNDINCGMELPSICKRSTDFVNTTLAPTPAPKGGCAPEWIPFQGKCYKFVVDKDKMTWENSRTHCIKQGGNLVSILNGREEAFLTMQMLQYPQDLWTGLNDVNSEMHFLWTDGRGVSYTNWAKGHPVREPDGRYSSVEEVFDCVVMVGNVPQQTGLWKVENCNAERGFICKRNVDSQIVVMPTTASPNAFLKFGNDSYKLETMKMNWEEARRQCRADDADLASILHPATHAFLSLQVDRLNQSVWIGLNNNLTDGRFKWVDKWPLFFTKWGKGEPKTNQACVYMDVDKTWKTAPCSDNYYSLCKQSEAIAPTEPPQLPGNCPEPKKKKTWIPFRGHCYSFRSFEVGDWAQATVQCLRTGGTLVSINDPAEARFIQQNIDLLQDGSKSFWIGLYKNHEDEWMWIDNSVVEYTNWNADMASKRTSTSTCVDVQSSSGKWSLNGCGRYKSFICKTPKTIKPTEKPPVAAPQSKKEASHGYTGVTVAVVLVSIALVGLAVFLLRKRIPRPTCTLGECTFDNHLYFNNPMRSSVDTKGLVANIEQNEQS